MSDEQRLEHRRRADSEMHERLARIETTLERMDHSLLGNGAPGAIADLHTRIDNIADQVDDLNGWRRWVHGIALAVGAIVGAAAWLWEHLHTSKG